MPINSACIREATLAEAPVVAHLFDLYRQFYDMPPDEQLALRFIRERMENDQSAIFVADDTDRGLITYRIFRTFNFAGGSFQSERTGDGRERRQADGERDPHR